MNNNLEHPKHYQLSIDIDILEIISIAMYNTNINCYDGYLLGTTIEYLFKADKNNELENCKIALYYLTKFFKGGTKRKSFKGFEMVIIEKIINTLKNRYLKIAMSDIFYLQFNDAEIVLKKYIKEQEQKQNDKED